MLKAACYRDCLIIDSLPGTGDEPLSVCKLIDNMDGAVIVNTPQKAATVDVRKSIPIDPMIAEACDSGQVFVQSYACNVPLELRAQLLFSCPPLYHLRADMRCGERLMAKAEGKFMRREQL